LENDLVINPDFVENLFDFSLVFGE
jgi:hypothetical protein